MGRVVLVVLSVLAAVVRAGPEATKERIASLKRSELERLEIHLGGKGALVPAVRIERLSEIRTFLTHLEGVAWRRVLSATAASSRARGRPPAGIRSTT